MIEFLRDLLGRQSHPLNIIYINSNAIIGNYKYLSSVNPQVKIAPVIKSNAYGHGIVPIGSIIDKLRPPFIAVDSLPEAYQLHKSGIKTPILIMGYIDPLSLKGKHLPFMYAVYNLELAEALNRYQKGAKVHIFLDTGMNREGVKVDLLPEFLKKILLMKHLSVEGLMHHMAKGYDSNSSITQLQLNNFIKALKYSEDKSINFRYKHIGGTNVIFHLDLVSYNVVRSGMGLFGRDPGIENKHLKPALRVTSKLVQIKSIQKGDRVGYDGAFVARKSMKIGIIPFGYNDGLDRRLSNKGVVKVNEVVCQILGYASMNMTTIDLTSVTAAYLGQEVELFSDSDKEPNSFVQAAKTARTTPYDLLVHLNPTTKRIVIEKGGGIEDQDS